MCAGGGGAVGAGKPMQRGASDLDDGHRVGGGRPGNLILMSGVCAECSGCCWAQMLDSHAFG